MNKRIIVPLDSELHAAVVDRAKHSGRSLADQVRWVLSAATGVEYQKSRQGRPPAPWLVVRTPRYGRTILSRHNTREAAMARVGENQEVMPVEKYERLTRR